MNTKPYIMNNNVQNVPPLQIQSISNLISLKGKRGAHFLLSKNTLYNNIDAEIGQGIKNIIRIYKAGLAGNVKNTEPRPKCPYSYK